MFDTVITTAIGILVSAVGGGVIGYVTGAVRTKRKKISAQSDGVCALLASKILDDHERYCIKNEHLTIERHQNIVDVCCAYQTLNPNDHTYEHYINDLRNKNPYQVIK